MKPPAVLRVGHLTYKIIATGEVARAAGDENGKCSPDTATIVLHPDQPLQVMRESLIHEALHAVTSMAGLAAELGDDKDEQYVNRLAPLLLGLLRDNPKAVAFLVGETAA